MQKYRVSFMVSTLDNDRTAPCLSQISIWKLWNYSILILCTGVPLSIVTVELEALFLIRWIFAKDRLKLILYHQQNNIPQ